MAKFRSNHSQVKNSKNNIIRVGIFGALVSALFFVFNWFSGGEAAQDLPLENYESAYFLPTFTNGQIIHHDHFSLSYNEEHEQAEWVAYVLSRDSLEKKWKKRSDRFVTDPAVESGSATPEDYRNSGYDRGHLVPAADRAFSSEAMQETFYMSNISPQSRNFNKGIWRELEELTRNWAKANRQLYVVTGPILSLEPKGKIGDSEVTIPAAFFKVLLDATEPQLKGIGFILPNQVSYEPLYKYAVSIDRVEEMTGIDFFSEMFTEEVEEGLESNVNIDLWEFNKERFELRVNKWNAQ